MLKDTTKTTETPKTVIVPSFVTALAIKPAKREGKRNVWSIDLQDTWIPAFTAMNANGAASISPSALGHPLNLVLEADGAPRYRNGVPVLRVAHEIRDAITQIKAQMVSEMAHYVANTIKDNGPAFSAQIALNHKAGGEVRAAQNAILAANPPPPLALPAPSPNT